jgi:hypothetical protein
LPNRRSAYAFTLRFVTAIAARKSGAGRFLRGLVFVRRGSRSAHFAAEETTHTGQPEHKGRGGQASGNYTSFELWREHRGHYIESVHYLLASRCRPIRQEFIVGVRIDSVIFHPPLSEAGV